MSLHSSIAPARRRTFTPYVLLYLLAACMAAAYLVFLGARPDLVALAAFGGWYLATMRTVPTPDVVGRSVAEARESLAGAGLTLEVASEEFSETVPRDLVISSDPAPGDGAREGGAVAVVVSKGPERYAVPDVSGQSPQQASAAISAAGLVPGATEQAFDNAAPSGSVVRCPRRPRRL